MRRFALAVAVLLTASAAQAVTISSSATWPGAGGVALTLDAAYFVASGGPGSGRSVAGDASQVATKSPLSPALFGRSSPFGDVWIDSNDNPTVEWNLAYEKPIKSVSFALTDAFDQGRDDRYGGTSFFNIVVGDAVWSISEREKNGTLHWITVLFDTPTDAATIRFNTRLNDGWGLSHAVVSPVPLPAAAWLLLAGIGALASRAGMRRRASRVTT